MQVFNKNLKSAFKIVMAFISTFYIILLFTLAITSLIPGFEKAILGFIVKLKLCFSKIT